MPNRPACPRPSNLQPWGAAPTGHGYQGGDLLGVAEHLDYLADLGINAIYFNPIFRSGSNHRYHTHDYYQVDPMLGGNAALRELLDAAHARGIRVVLDGVFNHASRGFFQFHDILENGAESAYLDWFTWRIGRCGPTAASRPTTACWWGNPALPKFNTDTPAVREFIWDVARYWIEFGIDGWRLDVPSEIDDDDVLARVPARGQGRQPRGLHRRRDLGRGGALAAGRSVRRGDELRRLARAALGFFAGETFDRHYRPGGFRLTPLRGRAFCIRSSTCCAAIPRPITQAQLNLLDSHDTARFIHQAGGDRERAAAGAALPDDAARRAVHLLRHRDRHGGRPRPRLPPRVPLADEASWDRDLLDFTRRAIALRKAHPALRRGRYQTLYAHEDVIAFARQGEGSAAVVVFNAGRESQLSPCDVDGLLPDGIADRSLGRAVRTRVAGHAAQSGVAAAQRRGVRQRVSAAALAVRAPLWPVSDRASTRVKSLVQLGVNPPKVCHCEGPQPRSNLRLQGWDCFASCLATGLPPSSQ